MREPTRRQLLAMSFIILLSPATRLLPGAAARAAGHAGWLCPLVAAPFCALVALLVSRALKDKAPGEGLGEVIMCALPHLGRAVLLVYGLWLALYAGFALRSGAARFIYTIYTGASPWVFVGIGLAMGLAAALAVPALTGYLDKGARQQALTEAHACVQACDTLLAEWHAAGETAARYGPDGSAPPAAAAGYHIAAGQTGGGMQPAGLAAVRELAGVPGRVEAAYRAADEITAYLVYTNDRHTVVYSSAGEAAALPGATPEPGGNPNVPPPATAAPPRTTAFPAASAQSVTATMTAGAILG